MGQVTISSSFGAYLLDRSEGTCFIYQWQFSSHLTKFLFKSSFLWGMEIIVPGWLKSYFERYKFMWKSRLYENINPTEAYKYFFRRYTISWHCNCHTLHQLNWRGRGVLVSLCPSIHLSVCPSVDFVHSILSTILAVSSTILAKSVSYLHMISTSEGVWLVNIFSKFKIWMFAKFFYLAH